MSWFKKLFHGRSERQTEDESTSKVETWLLKFESLNQFTYPEEDYENALEALEISMTNEVYALSTARNFRNESLDEFVCESDWVIVTRDQLMEPRFQRHLAKTDSLSTLCKSMVERSLNRRRAEIMARSPTCHCEELGRSLRQKKDQTMSFFRYLVTAFKRFWQKLKNKVKICCNCNHREVLKEAQTESYHISCFTNNYLCR